MFEHISVLLNECIDGLDIKANGVYVDGTLGGAGHSKEIYKKLDNSGKLICIDQDIDAINYAKTQLPQNNNIIFIHDNFSNIANILNNLEVNCIDGMLLDLGVSSYQLDTVDRGFSYMHDAKLDMRMDNRNEISAYDIVNSYKEDKLYKIIKEYGEERWAKRIAQFIVQERKSKNIETTFELVDVIKKAIPKGARESGPHPAKRTFQAIRIEVNNELKILEKTVNDIIDKLNIGGKLCIITFHSLEDRIIKSVFKENENPCTCLKEFPICICGKTPRVKIITKKPILPSENEILENHRSRSAKLRIIEKI